MKLKKLIISGFGPYAERQELDFQEHLDGKNMFVITGNTGAGKTTIFDAINFALYGEASGSERDGKSLRSDFAHGKTATEVELWFSLRSKDYYVKRSPQYFRAKQRGEGFTESKPSAELRLSEEKTITGPKEVTREIEDILGISAEQFKQLVMIPQGEFKKLLISDSDKKEDIFRKIFGTKIFSDIQQNIKDKGSVLKKSIEQVQRDRENRIRAFKSGEDEEIIRLINAKDLDIEKIMISFKESIDKDEINQKNINQKLGVTEENINNISKEIAIGIEVNAKLDKVKKYKIILEDLKSQVLVFERKDIILNKAKKAITVQGFEEKYNEKNKLYKRVKQQLDESKNKIDEYIKVYKDAEIALSKEQGREEEKNQLSKELDENEKLKIKAIEYEKNTKIAELLYKDVNDILKRIDNISKASNQNQERLSKININLQEINNAKDKKAQLSVQEINLINKKHKLKTLNDNIIEWKENKKRHEKGTIIYEKKDKEYDEVKEEYERLEDAFKRNQAGLLAKNLEKGDVCPVCGATEHPKLASLENISISEESVKVSKNKLEAISKERQKYLDELSKINGKMQSLEESTIIPMSKELLGENTLECCIDIKAIEGEVNKITEENQLLIHELKNNIDSLQRIIAKEKDLNLEKNTIENSNKTLSLELESRNKELVIKQGNLKAVENNLENIKKEFKDEIKGKEELEIIGLKLKNKIEEIKVAYIEAEKRFNSIKSSVDKEQGNCESAEKNMHTSKMELDSALELFKNKVLELGFVDYKDYIESKISESEMSLLEKEISDFKINLSNAKNIYEVSLKDSEGLKRIDLSLIEEKVKVEKVTKNNLENESRNIFSNINHNRSIIEDCRKLTKNIKGHEEEYKVVGRMSKIVNGDNEKKISFERYVLAAYFEDIIESANIRFTKMTCNRYELSRKEDIGDKRKGQGLDLEVFDNYTGKKRDVRTLSGGESFKASLAMALGLADVVQAHAGGIQLDTMFIDEGFGTLDPESLDNAIDCLVELQSDGRLVGVISHVQELKERIETRLEVSSTNKGSRAEFKS